MLRAEIRQAYYERLERPVLKDVAVSLSAGEFVVLLGANGCGKSTLLRCLSGIHQEFEGSIRLEGKLLGEWSLSERAGRISYLPQSVAPGFSFTVEEVILLSRYRDYGNTTEADWSERVHQAASLMEVTPLLTRRVDELSGGEWQRVAIARMFAQDANGLLLDEPTAHLDLAHRVALFRHCRAWARAGKAVLCATHDMDAALEFADRIIVLHDGGVHADGTVNEVMTKDLLNTVFATACVGIGEHPLSARPQLFLRADETKGNQ